MPTEAASRITSDGHGVIYKPGVTSRSLFRVSCIWMIKRRINVRNHFSCSHFAYFLSTTIHQECHKVSLYWISIDANAELSHEKIFQVKDKNIQEKQRLNINSREKKVKHIF